MFVNLSLELRSAQTTFKVAKRILCATLEDVGVEETGAEVDYAFRDYYSPTLLVGLIESFTVKLCPST